MTLGPLRPTREPTCHVCGGPHSLLFGRPDDYAVCADCTWMATGRTAGCWARHHAWSFGHAAGLIEP